MTVLGYEYTDKRYKTEYDAVIAALYKEGYSAYAIHKAIVAKHGEKALSVVGVWKKVKRLKEGLQKQ